MGPPTAAQAPVARPEAGHRPHAWVSPTGHHPHARVSPTGHCPHAQVSPASHQEATVWGLMSEPGHGGWPWWGQWAP